MTMVRLILGSRACQTLDLLETHFSTPGFLGLKSCSQVDFFPTSCQQLITLQPCKDSILFKEPVHKNKVVSKCLMKWPRQHSWSGWARYPIFSLCGNKITQKDTPAVPKWTGGWLKGVGTVLNPCSICGFWVRKSTSQWTGGTNDGQTSLSWVWMFCNES